MLLTRETVFRRHPEWFVSVEFVTDCHERHEDELTAPDANRTLAFFWLA